MFIKRVFTIFYNFLTRVKKEKIRFTVSKKRLVAFLGVFFIIVATITPSYYFYSKYQNSQKFIQSPTEVAKEEVKQLVAKVSKLVELPEDGEEPTVATVSDKDKLKEQPFFKRVANGDKVLIFTQAKKAILYRPGTNKVIEMSSLSLSVSPEVATVSAKVALYNGTQIAGLAETVEKQLKGNSEVGSRIEIVLRGNSKNDYTKTIVVDINGEQQEVAEKIAKILGGSVGSLPEGEAKPEADILVIIGK